MSKLLNQKIKSQINHSSLTSEETDFLKNDKISNNKHIQQVWNTAKKIFKIALTSNNPDILKNTEIVKDENGDGTHFYMSLFVG